MLLEKIADYAIREQTAALRPEVIHHAKRAVIDWYAALLPGSVVTPATLLEQACAEDLDRGRARLASGRRATLRAAALINGAASHSVEFDDIYRDAGYHLGSIYFNYGITAVLVIVIYFTMFFRDWLTDTQRLVVLSLFAILFPMWFFRYARALWMAFDERWDPWPNVEEAREIDRAMRQKSTSTQ